MSTKFELFLGKDKQYYFRLKASNGENILSSQAYQTKSNCQKGIESVKNNAPNLDHFKRNTSQSGKFSFSLKAANGEIIGTSQTYISENGRDNGIQSVSKNAPIASIIDLTSES